MNKSMRIFIGLCLLVGFKASIARLPQTDESSIVGEWRYVSAQHEGKKPYSTFVVKLRKSSGNQIAGSYCFITDKGGRVDCDPGGASNLDGTIAPDGLSATINFFSFFGAKKWRLGCFVG